MNAKEILENIYHEGMIKYEQICEELLEKVTDEEALKFQVILDEAQQIFESQETSILQKKNENCMTIKEITRAKTFIHAYMHPLDYGEQEQTKRKYRDTAIMCMENEIERLKEQMDHEVELLMEHVDPITIEYPEEGLNQMKEEFPIPHVNHPYYLKVGSMVTINEVSYKVKSIDFSCIVLEDEKGNTLELTMNKLLSFEMR